MFLVWIVFVVATVIIAEQKKRNAPGWFFLGLFFGPLAFIAVMLLPKRQASPPSGIFTGPVAASKDSLKAELDILHQQLNVLSARVQHLAVKIEGSQQPAADQPASPQIAQPSQPAQPVPSQPSLEPADTKAASGRRVDLEANLGKYWLNKIGIIIFSLGVAFLLTYTFAHFGPLAKIIFGYAVAGALFIAGIKLEQSERFTNYGRVLLGGAWAITYFTSFAMYHFPAAKIIDNRLLDLVLLAAVCAGIILHSLRYRSEALTAIALFIGFVTCVLGDVSSFALASACVLAIAALVLVWRMQWVRFVFLGIVLTYLTHFVWVIKQIAMTTVPAGALNVENILFHFDAGFLIIYWVLFTVAVHVLRSETRDPSFRKLAAANFSNFLLFFLMFYPKLHYFYPDQRFNVVLGFGLAYLMLGFICELIKRHAVVVSDIVVAVSLITVSVPLKFMPYHTSVVWFVELPFLLLVGMIFKRRVYRYLGFAVLAILFVRFVLGFYGSGDDTLWLGTVRTTWQAFLAFIGFVSTAACYALYRSLHKKDDWESVVRHFYSGFAVVYLAFYLSEVVREPWLALGLSFASLAVFVAGALLKDRVVRWYGLIVMAIAGVRFCFDRYDAPAELQQLALTYGPIACAFSEYAAFRLLNRKGLTVAGESWLSRVLFICAASLGVFAAVVYVQPMWITLSIALLGLCALVWGARSRETFIRVYSLLVLGLGALRFSFIDSYGGMSDVVQWSLIAAKLFFAYAAYFVYRALALKGRLGDGEKTLTGAVFYVAAALTVLAVFKYVAGTWVSLSLGVVGVAMFSVGFLVGEKVFRHGGFIIFGLTLARVAFVDLAGLPIIYKIVSFIVIGVLFLGVSFIYTKYLLDKK
ncbi:MAG: DUF2339 domain-containing protein [Candidatus Omnitrophica bacterium]|nr:DUF2339 domain-containing protein [Candidatus Omnitrophota bacterium]